MTAIATISHEHLSLLEQQLGRPPRSLDAMGAVSASGIPLVVRMRPLMEGKPFPTLYWLTSRDLFKAISTIEAQGYIKQLEARVEDDSTFRQALWDSHADYAAQRLHYMNAEDKAQLQALDKLEAINKLGVGGIADWSRIRCLHTHYAHHLCGHNVVGQWLEQQFQLSQLPITL
ncbi:DUF501 domain-containing protein [Balneatrix alpica]|uniref:DUF501 domain-containing protein n=1 Tax=Balneatrix alpica TaxID=75684 RepID=A0ABV5ZA66_9GAMM|nr:DUF501 domain-containing protein [Balneatrix alpica]